MDREDMFRRNPLNRLPKKCPACGFPDLDHVPQPCFLVKSRTLSPNELALAESGNFFVRERVRRALDLVAPDLCRYFPTHFKGTLQTTSWLLAVPTRKVVTGQVIPAIPRCENCGEPRSAHPGTQWAGGRQRNDSPRDEVFDAFKSATWGSSELGWDRWISVGVFMSVRLLHLLYAIKAKDFCESTLAKPLTPNVEESAWIKEQLEILEGNGIPFHADGTLSRGDTKWLRDYLKTHRCEATPEFDLKAVERRLKIKLPKSYRDFVTTVGVATFANVDEEGAEVSLVEPERLGLNEEIGPCEDEESKAIQPLAFATSEHGNYYCFDVQKDRREFPVFIYNHECQYFEPYAENFAACIKRFAGG